MKILGELLSVINTLNIHVNVEDSDDITNVEVEKKVLTLWKSDKSSCVKINLCKGVQLKLNSSSGLSYECDWLSFRVQLETKSSIINSVLGELSRDIQSLSLNIKEECDLVDRPVQVKCKCNFSLTDVRIFTKICELPSVNWDSASENWFCHLEEVHKDSMKSHNLIPRENECFYNELVVCFNSNICTVQPAVDGMVICPRCLLEIGTKKKNDIKLWANKIKWVSEDKVIFSKTPSEILLSLFHNLEKDSLGANSRIALELNGPTKEFLYIVTMDSHLSLLVSENSPLKNYTQCQTQPKKQCLEDQTNLFMKKLKSVKVLYKHKMKEDEESGEWVDNVNVNILPCGQSFFSSVSELLESSTECLPYNVRIIKDMKVGYIVNE